MTELAYATLGSSRLAEALEFYDALMASIGFEAVMDHPSGGRVYAGMAGAKLAVLGPYDGEIATAGNGSMIAFRFDRRDEVSAFHAKGVALGGADAGRPGERAPGRFYAYVRDLDGHKLCAFCLD